MSETILISDRGNTNLIEDFRRSRAVYAYDESIAMADYKRDSDVIPDPSQPTWEVYIDGTRTTGKLLHMTGIDDSSRYVLSAQLSLQVGEAGSFSFTITPNHILYDEITPYKTTVNVYQEGVELFRGRVTGYSTDIERQRQVECEGDLAYLSDVIFPNSEISTKDRTLAAAFGYFVQLYNKFGELKPGDTRYLVPGDVSISKANYTVKVSEWIGTEKSATEFTDARSLIDEFIETFGGYLRTKRKEDGYVYLEYISGYTDVNDQTIAYGSNLLEFSIESKPDDLFTVLVPLGDSDEEQDEAITIARVNTKRDSSVKNATLVHNKVSGWKGRELVWEEGVKLYGRIVKQETFNGITSSSELMSRSMAYFRECIAGHLGNYTLKAVDQHFLDPANRPIYLGQKVRIVSALHGIDTADQPLTCMKIDYDLSNPETVSCEFDIPFQPLTNTFTSKYKQQQEEQDRELDEAKQSVKKAHKKNGKQDGEIEGVQNEVDEHDDLLDSIIDGLSELGVHISKRGIGKSGDSGEKKATKDKADQSEDVDGVFWSYDANGNRVNEGVVVGGKVVNKNLGKVEMSKN